MYKLRVRTDKQCKCGNICKLYSPKGYDSIKCKCFLCESCWIGNYDSNCKQCNYNIVEWLNEIMKINECSICLLTKKLTKSPCGHSICKDCWDETGERKPECPFCRKNLTRWMIKNGVNISTKEMYDEDSLPYMDSEEEDDSMSNLISLLTIINGTIVRCNLYPID